MCGILVPVSAQDVDEIVGVVQRSLDSYQKKGPEVL